MASSPATYPDASTEDGNHDRNSCPICLCSVATTPDLVLGFGPCSHSVCVPCLETLLNTDASSKRWPPAQVQPSDAHLAAPTLGRCPICRAELDLFEIRNVINEELLYEKNRNWQGSPFANKTFVLYGGGGRKNIGNWSIHFALDADEAHPVTPYIDVSKDIARYPDDWILDDGTTAPTKLYMEEGCHFHAPSRTFHGTIVWPARLQASHQWDIKLGFSRDFRFLSSGIIWKRRELTVPPEQRLSLSDYDRNGLSLKDFQLRCQYPLDGKWIIGWFGKDGKQKTGYITVVGNVFKQSNYFFYINYTNPSQICIRWPKSDTVQTIQSGINLVDKPLGPGVDDVVTWTTPSPNFPKIYWKRETFGRLPPPPKVLLFGTGGHGKLLFQRLHETEDDDDGNDDGEACIPKFNKDSIWGNVFCKRLRVGSASYHFVSPERGAYISYEHPACRDLPPLDDGTPLPTRVSFHNIDWNEHERKFVGTIEWEQDFGTSWNDNIRWKMDMQFDSEFVTILKGGIQCEWCHERRAPVRPRRPPPSSRPPPVAIYVPPTPPQDPAQQQPPPPERNEEWRMSGYGYDQLYINAAILERFRNETADAGEAEEEENQEKQKSEEERKEEEEKEEEGQNTRLSRISKRVCNRLKMEGATDRTIEAVGGVFKAAQERDANPIDYNIF